MKKFDEVFHLDSITINVTNNCNLNCSYCFEKSKNKMVLSPEKAIKAVDIAYRGCKNRPMGFMINFFGGEPLLAWNTMKAVMDYCDEQGWNDIKYGVTSNMTLVTDEFVDYCEKFHMGVLASIDGIKPIHDKNRCNSFDKAMAGLQKFKDRNLLHLIEARMTIPPESIKYAYDGVKMLYDFGIDNLCPMCVYDLEWSKEQLEEVDKFYHKLFQLYLKDATDLDSKRNIYIKNCNDIIMQSLNAELGSDSMCPIFSEKWVTIDYLGDVYACHQSPTSKPELKDNFKLGNIFTGVDEEKLNNKSEIYKTCRFEMDKCNDCIGKSICKGGCPSENIRMNHIHDKPTEAYCEITKIMVRNALANQDALLNAPNTRNRQINNLIENLKVKKYLDNVISSGKLNIEDKLFYHKAKAQITHLNEMITALEDNKMMMPSFQEYFDSKLEALFLALSLLLNQDVEKIVEKTNKGEKANG